MPQTLFLFSQHPTVITLINFFIIRATVILKAPKVIIDQQMVGVIRPKQKHVPDQDKQAVQKTC